MFRSMLALLVVVLVAATTVMAQSVVGSKHDLSSGGGINQIANHSSNESQVCIFCHTPHQKSVTASPLWNHTMSGTTSYGVYTSSTMNATGAAIVDIGGGTGVSNLCMSCHDGTVAVNNLGNRSTVGVPTMGTGAELNGTFSIASGRDANMGTSLTDDHPINFTYDAALATADGGLKTPASGNFVDVGNLVPLFAGKVQCASCHDAHNNVHGSFTRVSNAGSALCLTCHSK